MSKNKMGWRKEGSLIQKTKIRGKTLQEEEVT